MYSSWGNILFARHIPGSQIEGSWLLMVAAAAAAADPVQAAAAGRAPPEKHHNSPTRALLREFAKFGEPARPGQRASERMAYHPLLLLLSAVAAF